MAVMVQGLFRSSVPFAPEEMPYFEIWTPQDFLRVLSCQSEGAVHTVYEMSEFVLFAYYAVSVVIHSKIPGCHYFVQQELSPLVVGWCEHMTFVQVEYFLHNEHYRCRKTHKTKGF